MTSVCCIPICIRLILIFLVVLLPRLNHPEAKNIDESSQYGELKCVNGCKLSLTESIPIGMVYDNDSIIYQSTYSSWMDLIKSAKHTIEIVAFYWTMNGNEVYPDDSAKPGENVLEALVEAGRDRGITLKIAQNTPIPRVGNNSDSEYLAKVANAEVRTLNFTSFFGSGMLHTKLLLIDRLHLYVGSANMDWRALTQVKELGFLAMNCPCLARDTAKIFDVYWQLGAEGRIPAKWPDSLSTQINMQNPMKLTIDQNTYSSFITSAPGPLSPKGRTNDIDGVLYCIRKAEKFVYVSFMDYFPMTLYTPKMKYWPVIDDALRSAAINRKINIRLSLAYWKHSPPSESYFLRSLADLTDSYENVKIEVKRFVVPTNAHYDKIPFGRVNHNKYMVTDLAAYMSTSNWAGDYFTDTAGIGMIFEDVGDKNNNSIRQQLEQLFLRDWNSPYSFNQEDLRKMNVTG